MFNTNITEEYFVAMYQCFKLINLFIIIIYFLIYYLLLFPNCRHYDCLVLLSQCNSQVKDKHTNEDYCMPLIISHFAI